MYVTKGCKQCYFCITGMLISFLLMFWLYIYIIKSTAQDSLGKNVSKEVCFWLWGKDNLVQLPKRTQRYVNSGCSLFFWGSNGVSQVCLLTGFINKAQFDAGFAHGLILKDGEVPAIKDPGHDSELQMVSETASNVCVLLVISAHVLVTL